MSYRPIGGRRQRSAAWQWALIGFIPGLFCGVSVMIGVMLEGTLPTYFLPTSEPQVVTTVVHIVMTATEDASLPTPTPLSQFIVVTATSDSAFGERHRIGRGPSDPSASRYQRSRVSTGAAKAGSHRCPAAARGADDSAYQ